MMGSCKSLVSAAKRALTEENQDNAYENNANGNVEGTLKRLYLCIFYSSMAFRTIKSKVPSRKDLLKPSDICVSENDRTNKTKTVGDIIKDIFTCQSRKIPGGGDKGGLPCIPSPQFLTMFFIIKGDKKKLKKSKIKKNWDSVSLAQIVFKQTK